MTVFDQRKRHILDDLQSNEPDLSPKGKPDDEIVGLLELINACEDYVSTSSCSGRAVVFLDADKVGEGEDASGRWLMTRHTKFEGSLENSTIEELFAMLFGHLNIGSDWESNGQSSRLITLKFEPLIMHVLCRDVPAASRLLHIATASGYRESGISISAIGTPQEKVLIAIRTTAIRTDIPLASYDGDTRTVRPFGLTRGYFVNLINLLNDKFSENDLRKQNLFTSLQGSLNTPQSTATNETKDQRRRRKREEGLRLQSAKSQNDVLQDTRSGGKDVLNDSTSLDHLATI